MRRSSIPSPAFVVATSLVVLAGCGGGQRVLVPARIDLSPYQTIGMVEFRSNAEGNLQEFTSQRFVESVQAAQPGVRILELGREEDVLAALDRPRMDYETIRALADRYEVGAVFVGEMEVTDAKPSVSLSSMLSSLAVNADVEANLTTKLYEARSGATLWTSSARGKENVAHVSLASSQPIRFGASDPEAAYGKLVDALVGDVTQDFRSHFRKR
jgi:hypothetical protein